MFPQAEVARLETREFTLSSQPLEAEDAPTQMLPSQAEVARLETREFSLQAESGGNGTRGRGAAGSGEKTTQGLQFGLTEIARIQLHPCAESEPEVTTNALSNPDLPLVALVQQMGRHNENQVDLDDDDDRTICLHDRKLSQLRTISLREPISDRLPDIEVNTRRSARRVHAPQRHS